MSTAAPIPASGLRQPVSHRKPRWERLLTDAIMARAGQPFVLGSTDCVPTACNLLAAYTDLDLLARHPVITDEQEAHAYLARHGGLLALTERTLRALGVNQTSVNAALRGDLAFVVLPDGREGLGIFGTTGILVPGKEGLTNLARRRATHAWRIV